MCGLSCMGGVSGMAAVGGATPCLVEVLSCGQLWALVAAFERCMPRTLE